MRRFQDQDTITISWAAAGSLGSEDGRPRTDIGRAIAFVSEDAVIGFNVEGSLPGTGAPIGSAQCRLGEGEVQWSSNVRIPRQSDARAD